MKSISVITLAGSVLLAGMAIAGCGSGKPVTAPEGSAPPSGQLGQVQQAPAPKLALPTK